MKSALKTASALTALAAFAALGACAGDTPEEIAAKEAAMRICPPGNVLADISSYSTEMPPPNLEQPEWFTQNGELGNIRETPSGLQYRVNQSGDAKGPTPTPTQTVRVNYHGLLRDGRTFDSSYDRGKDIEFPLNRVIPGWTEGVGLMRPCDAWTFYIPSDLAYGSRGASNLIGPDTPLVFHVQLIEISE